MYDYVRKNENLRLQLIHLTASKPVPLYMCMTKSWIDKKIIEFKFETLFLIKILCQENVRIRKRYYVKYMHQKCKHTNLNNNFKWLSSINDIIRNSIINTRLRKKKCLNNRTTKATLLYIIRTQEIIVKVIIIHIQSFNVYIG